MTDKTDQLQLDPSCYEDATSYFEEMQHDPEYRQAMLEESVRIQIAQAIHNKRKTLNMRNKSRDNQGTKSGTKSRDSILF